MKPEKYSQQVQLFECSYSELQQNLKVAHIIGERLNYSDAAEACEKNQMKLFVIDNAEVESAFLDAHKSLFESGTTLWINGNRSSSDGLWSEYSQTVYQFGHHVF